MSKQGLQGGKHFSVCRDGTETVIDVKNVVPSDLVIKCGESKTLVLDNTTWEDMSFPLAIGKPTAGGKPDFDYTNVGYLFPQNDKTEIILIRIQLKHAWKEGTTIFPHVHWRQKANQTPVFKMDYKWYNVGESEPATWSTYTMNQLSIPYTSGTIGQISKGILGLDGTGKTVSSMLLVKLYRDDNVYTGDVLVDDFDIHIEIDTFGSRQEYIK